MVARKAGQQCSRSEVMEEILVQWQALWDVTSTKAAWTKRLIPDLKRWWQYGPREISYHMAQALTGHRCFQSFLFKRGRATSLACVHCSAEMDDVEHTIFNCTLWEECREGLAVAVGRRIVPEDFADLLCEVSCPKTQRGGGDYWKQPRHTGSSSRRWLSRYCQRKKVLKGRGS